MGKRAYNPDGMPVPRGSYHQVAVADAGRLVAIAGQTASDGDGNIVGEGDIKAQTREVLRKIKVGVESAGGTMDDVITMTVFITDARFYRDVNDTRREVLGDNFPTSTLVNIVSLARPGLLIEINALAVVPEDRLKG